MLEQQDHGFHTMRFFDDVCEHCIADAGLAAFAAQSGGIRDQCDFCGRRHVHGMPLGGLFRYMAGCIAAEWDDPLDCVVWDDGWVPGVNVIDSDDLLIALDEPLQHPALRAEFVSAFQHEWCQRDPYRLDYPTTLILSWGRFAHLVKTRHRYLFLRRNSDRDDDLVAPAEMLQTVAQAIHNVPDRMFRQAPAGTAVVRARVHGAEEYPQSADMLGSPPPERARPNRMSPAGISMFYAADEPTTAVREVRPRTGDGVTVAIWTTRREIWCLDLTRVHPVSGLFDMVGRANRPWLRFLAHFADQLAAPAGASPEVDYVPTQIVTEFVRDYLHAPTGEPIEAIVYQSALDSGRDCWVIFAEPDQCAAAADADAKHLLVLDSSSVSRSVWPNDAFDSLRPPPTPATSQTVRRAAAG